ncbi:MAG: recombination mediator RecR [bacterium]
MVTSSASPKILNQLIEQLGKLPGIGPKSAARIAFHLVNMPENQVTEFANTLIRLKSELKFCTICHNLGEKEVCNICSDESRDQTQIMLVEDVLDLIAFERLHEYRGLYHVLGGVISPVNGIGPNELFLTSLFLRFAKGNFQELIIATNPNLEGEATAMYVKNEMSKVASEIKISRIARGVPSGADLDYTDKYTLSRALIGRTEL